MLQKQKGEGPAFDSRSDDYFGKSVVVFGCGYLGSRIVADAIAKGGRVTALTRDAARAATVKTLGATALVANIEERNWHRHLQGNYDFAVLCAGAGGGGSLAYRKSYLDSMESILEWASERCLGGMIFTSSTSVYAQDAGEVVTESDPARGTTTGSSILLETEDLLLGAKSIERRGILRLGGLYGPGRHRLLDRVRARDFSMTAQDERGVLNIIQVEDVVGAVAAAARDSEARREIYNIVDDAPSPRAEVISWIREEVRKRGLVRDRPGGPRMHAPSRRGGNRFVSNRKARAQLGWYPAYSDFRAGYGSLLDSLEAEATQISRDNK